MNNYYAKYIKYKIKYMSHKDKNGKKFKEFIKSNVSDAMIHIDFLHDNASAKVKGKEFYDMVKNKPVKIYSGAKPTDLENFMHNELVDLAVEADSHSVFANQFANSKTITKYKDLSEYTCVLDKSVDNQEMVLKLKTIFNITQFEKTFVGNCKQFLNSTGQIDKAYLTPKSNLKHEYLAQAIKIGLTPISKNQLINFNALDKPDGQVVFNELVKIKLYIEETLKSIGKVKKYFTPDFLIKFITDLSGGKNLLNEINNSNDIKTKYLGTTDEAIKTRNLIEKIVFSLKEARDIYYVEEIKKLMETNPDKKYILVSGDLVQSYRAICANISTINVVLTIIRFMGIYKSNKLSIIGNPFELVSSNKNIINNYMTDTIKKNIISMILSNPIINLRKSKAFSAKYFFDNYEQIYTRDFMVGMAEIFVDDPGIPGPTEHSSTELNLEKKKAYMDYLLDFASNNIEDETDLLYVIKHIKSKFDLDFAFDLAINNINWQIQANTSDLPVNPTDKPIESSTWQFQILYLCTLFKGFSMIEYIIPVAKKLYPNKFNWEEIEQLS